MINNCISINYFQLLRISNRDMDCPAHVLWFSRNFIKLKKSPYNFNEVLFPHTNCYLLYNCHPENKYVNTLPSISILYIITFFHFFHFFLLHKTGLVSSTPHGQQKARDSSSGNINSMNRHFP